MGFLKGACVGYMGTLGDVCIGCMGFLEGVCIDYMGTLAGVCIVCMGFLEGVCIGYMGMLGGVFVVYMEFIEGVCIGYIGTLAGVCIGCIKRLGEFCPFTATEVWKMKYSYDCFEPVGVKISTTARFWTLAKGCVRHADCRQHGHI